MKQLAANLLKISWAETFFNAILLRPKTEVLIGCPNNPKRWQKKPLSQWVRQLPHFDFILKNIIFCVLQRTSLSLPCNSSKSTRCQCGTTLLSQTPHRQVSGTLYNMGHCLTWSLCVLWNSRMRLEHQSFQSAMVVMNDHSHQKTALVTEFSSKANIWRIKECCLWFLLHSVTDVSTIHSVGWVYIALHESCILLWSVPNLLSIWATD